jgi:hypothetical protein
VPDLVREQHALVDERARRHRRHVELLAVTQRERLDRMARALPDDVELALERVLVDVAPAATDEHLPDHRLDFLGAIGQAGVVGRHVAPAKQNLAFGRDRALDLLLARHARGRLTRQEHHSHAVLTHRRQRDAELAAGTAQEYVGHLDQDAGAVALQGVRARRTPMRQVVQDLEALPDDGVILATLDVGDEAQPACVVLVGGVV